MDSVDRDLVLALLAKEQTIHQLSKRLGKRDSFLRYRLGRLAEDGLVRKRNHGEKGTYFVPLDSITYGKARLVVTVSEKGAPIAVELGPVLVTDHDGTRQVIVLT